MEISTLSLHMASNSVSTHNNRKGWFVKMEEHIKLNSEFIVYKDENLKDVYDKLFGDAINEFNAKQKHKNRMIDDYYQQMRMSHKKRNGRKAYYEIVLEVGDLLRHPSAEKSRSICDEYLKGFLERNKNFYVSQAVWHNDERAKVWNDKEHKYEWIDSIPHLHIQFVPFSHSNRGLKVQVNLRGAFREMGFIDKSNDIFWNNNFNQWIAKEREICKDLCESRDIMIIKGDPKNRVHYTPQQYRNLQIEREKLKADVSRFKNEISKSVKQLEVLDAQKADFNEQIEKKKDELENLPVSESEIRADERNKVLNELEELRNRLKKLECDKEKAERKAKTLDRVAERFIREKKDDWEDIKGLFDDLDVEEYESKHSDKKNIEKNRL